MEQALKKETSEIKVPWQQPISKVKSPQDILKDAGVKVTTVKRSGAGHLILLIDLSGSMNDHLDVGSKAAVVQDTIRTQLAPNLMGSHYSVCIFQDDEVGWLYTISNSPTQLAQVELPMAHGSTPMMKALNTAWSAIAVNPASVQSRIILITDGLPTDEMPDNILHKARNQTDVPIDVIGIGHGNAAYDPEFLLELATITGGIFVEPQNAAQLVQAMKQLSPAVRGMIGTSL